MSLRLIFTFIPLSVIAVATTTLGYFAGKNPVTIQLAVITVAT